MNPKLKPSSSTKKSNHHASKSKFKWDVFISPDAVSLIVKIIALIVVLTSVLVICGWVFDISSLKSILPGWVTMKFITAVIFLFTGILVYLLNLKISNDILSYFSVIVSFLILIVMVVFIVSLFTGVGTGIESLFVKEKPGAVMTTVPGVPAIPTIICFIIIGFAKIAMLIDNNKRRCLLWFGASMLLISLSAVIGYILNIPSLYYNWIGFTAMAFHTALLFFLISISFILMGINNRGLNGNGNNGNNNHNHNHNNGIKIKAISENNL